MSSRRSRFKIAANIPVRRKVASSLDTKTENVKCLETPVKTECDPVTQDVIRSVDENPSLNSACIPSNSVTSPVKISNLKASKPIIPFSDRKQILTNETVKIEKIFGSDGTPLLKKEKINNVNEQATIELSDQQDRPRTPPPSMLSSALSGVLKSPVRGRFVRPSLVDSANRRHSFHASSASESEDESRRLQNVSKARKISETSPKLENSTITQYPNEKCTEGLESVECARLALMPKRRRAKVSNFVRKIAEARRDFKKKFAREKPERSKLTMFDLIFYNPGSKISTEGCETKEDAIKSNIPQEEKLQEEEVDDPENNESDAADEAAVPVPQVKIGANGEIILDEKSLVIETTEAKKGREALMNAVPIFEDKNRRVSYFGNRKKSTKEWSPIETKCFYKALNSVGTDFAMMQALFPDRTRAELKNKFKREDRINSQLIDIALLNPAAFNIKLLKEQLDMERTLVERETKRQIEEKAKTEQMRKEALSRKRKLSQDENQCVSSLKQFIKIDDDLPKAPRSKRGTQRRKLCEDFVDPFQVSEDSFIRFKKPCAVSNVKKEIANVDIKISTVEPIASTRKIIRPKNSKDVIEKNNVIYPIEESISDSDSISSLNFNEKTEEIGNHEFVELLNRNFKNLEPTTIRFLAPSSTNTGNPNIRVVLNVPNDKGDMKKHLSIIEGVSSPFLEEKYICPKTEIVDFRLSSQTEVNVEQSTVQNEYEVLVDNLNELHNLDQATAENNSEQNQINPNITLASSSDADLRNIETEVSMNNMSNEEPALFEGPITLEDCEPELIENNPPFTFERDEPPYSPANLAIESGAISTEDSVENRTSGGFQYTVIKSGTSSDEKRTYLAGLTPGSFVFMATETEVPLEQRCSMYMISEKISADGEKEYVPLPVFLPPELMKLISNDMK